MVNENARQRIADGSVHQRGGDRGVDPAGQTADQPAALGLSLDRGHGLVDDVGGGPARPDAGDLVQEPAQHLLTVRGMHHLRVVLHPGQPPAGVLERRHRSTGRPGGDHEAARRGGDGVAVAHPHRTPRGQLAVQHTATLEHLQIGAPVLPGAGLLHGAAQGVGHRLEAVADAQHRHPRLEQRRVDARSIRRIHAGRATGQHDRSRLAGEEIPDRRGVWHHLGVHLRLADPSRDQLGVLRPEVDDQNRP